MESRKKSYESPRMEVFLLQPERGFASSQTVYAGQEELPQNSVSWVPADASASTTSAW